MEQKTGYVKLLEAVQIIEERSSTRFVPVKQAPAILLVADKDAYLEFDLDARKMNLTPNINVTFRAKIKFSNHHTAGMGLSEMEALRREAANACEIFNKLGPLDIRVTSEEFDDFLRHIHQRGAPQQDAGPTMTQSM